MNNGSDHRCDQELLRAMHESIHQLIHTAQSLDREHCIAQLRRLRRPKIDFTDEFLQGQSLERLRHIVVAAFIQARKAQS